ncbi:MAG: YicC family protein, partial [Bacteroidetes bacterium]|nr:YicC family protein [Bacteroidota bacterium]
MVLSMTGFGRGEVTEKGVTGSVELRSVNSRFLEVVARLPRALALRENEVKDAVRQRMSRGKVNVQVTIERETDGTIPVKLNAHTARAYATMLNQLRKTARIRETVKLEHLLQFSDI